MISIDRRLQSQFIQQSLSANGRSRKAWECDFGSNIAATFGKIRRRSWHAAVSSERDNLDLVQCRQLARNYKIVNF